jgi:hypothetical protein
LYLASCFLLLLTPQAWATNSIGETNAGDQCTIQSGEGEAFEAQLQAAYDKNRSDLAQGLPGCPCVLVASSDGPQTFYSFTEDGPEEVRYCVELQEPIAGTRAVVGKDGVGLLSNFIQQIYIYGASIIGIICVLIIVVSGIQISLGGANSEFVNQGKERILQALLSLILLFASALILRTINPGFFTI